MENLPLTSELLQEDVFMRFMASQQSKEFDLAIVRVIVYDADCDVNVPESFHRPTIFSTLTATPIAFANNVWASDHGLVERKVLKNGLTRFRLGEGAGGWFWFWLNEGVEEAWLCQSSNIFQSRGISLEDDVGVYKLVYPEVELAGDLDPTPSKTQRRRQQPIYLFVRPPPRNSLDDKTSRVHFWSFHEDGQHRLSPESCRNFGLPLELCFRVRGICSKSWSTSSYQLIRRYQTLRSFDPTTPDFARHLGFDDRIFQPIHHSDRFMEVYQEHSDNLDRSVIGNDSECPSHTMVQKLAEDPVCMASSQAGSEPTINSSYAPNKRQRMDMGFGGAERNNPEPEPCRNIDATSDVRAMEEQFLPPFRPRTQPFKEDSPTIVSILAETSIAVANSSWASECGSLVDRKVLENRLTRFRLREGKGSKLLLLLNWNVEEAWLLQACGVFCGRGISLKEGLEDFELRWHQAQLYGSLNPRTLSERHEQSPIYLFVRFPPPGLLSGDTSSLHYWSCYEDGQSQIPPGSYRNFGLSVELKFLDCGLRLLSWPTEEYRLVHRYQLLQGFDPTTTDFAQHLQYDHCIFQPNDDSDRFEDIVHEVFHPGRSTIGADSGGQLNPQDDKLVQDASSCGSSQVPTAPCDGANGFTITGDNGPSKRQRGDTQVIEIESGTQPDQDSLSLQATVVAGDRAAGSAVSTVNTNNPVTTVRNTNHAQSVGRLGIEPHISPTVAKSNGKLHNNRPATQLAPPLRRQILNSPMRPFMPTSLISQTLTTLRPSPITVEVLPFTSSSNTAMLRSFLPGDTPTIPRHRHCHLVKMGGVPVSPLEARDDDGTPPESGRS
ncbi:hypothetical protein PM082_006265 [Marasmius tenuissimus]|nr:hypothetical protein PM082_006265 [Marasmius tenuissimus]